MSNTKGSFRKEIKKLASERKKRRERNERDLKKEYKAADVTECGHPYIGCVDDIGRGKPEEAVRRLREYAELRNRIMLMTEEAMVETRRVIREEVKPKPLTVKQLKLILGKVRIHYDYNPKRSHLLQLYREKVAEPPRSVSEIEVMTAIEMKRELSRLGLDFLTNMSKPVLKKILVDNAVRNKDLKLKPFEWSHRVSRSWFAISQWYFTRKLTTEPFTIWAFVKGKEKCVYNKIEMSFRNRITWNGFQSMENLSKISNNGVNVNVFSWDEDDGFHTSKTRCYVCNCKFTENNYKVRDHCHFTGKYREGPSYNCKKLEIKLDRKEMKISSSHRNSRFSSEFIVLLLRSKNGIGIVNSRFTGEESVSDT
ncbi:Hypothetical predicted protein [Paramuricea clavata]|uniref:Uncharacterized protein n=1 Tax=Paramuricea clavata TaxID=317549 RepID=A0A7D9I1F3_PARCT|nr:Hypothetical predicted protein [Paramuricea clavata]